MIWVGVINWRYPGGWLQAGVIGIGAWGAAIVILWLLSSIDIVDVGAIGVPV